MRRYATTLLPSMCLLVLFISACSNNNLVATPITSNVQPIMSTPTALRTETRIAQISACWPINQITKNIKGSLMFQDQEGQVFAWDASTFHTESIIGFPEELQGSHGNYIVSSDGGTIVGLIPPSKLIVISRGHTTPYQLPENGYDLDIEYLDDGKIRIPFSKASINSYIEGTGITDRFYTFDPITGEIAEHSVFLPGFLIVKRNVWAIEYSPNMHFAIYLTALGDQGPQFTLYDLVERKVVWTGPQATLNMSAEFGRMPIWTPDSSGLTYPFITDQAGYGNYYLIGLNGKLSELTHLEQTEIMGLGGGWLNQPFWSPDGRYLAFRAAQDTQGPIRLHIWDAKENVALTPCLPDEDLVDQGYRVYWSFDGAYLLITLCYPNYEIQKDGALCSRFNTIILDMVNNEIIQLPDQNHRGKFSSSYSDGIKTFLGWVNWEIP